MWKNHSRVRQAADDNIIWSWKDAICLPDNQGKNIDTILINTYCFSATKIVEEGNDATILCYTYVACLFLPCSQLTMWNSSPECVE